LERPRDRREAGRWQHASRPRACCAASGRVEAALLARGGAAPARELLRDAIGEEGVPLQELVDECEDAPLP
jgi:hypothetical protein